MVSAKKQTQSKYSTAGLRPTISAGTMFDAVALTKYFEEEIGKLLQHLHGEPHLHLKLVLDTKELQPTDLSSAEVGRFQKLAATPRASSWMRGRSVLKQLLRRCGLDDETTNVQFPHQALSLTHSDQYAVGVQAKLVTASAQSPEYQLIGTGVDFEVTRKVNPRATRFFLQESEVTALTDGDRLHDNSVLLRLWTAKEAIFKADPENAQTFPGGYTLLNPLESSGWAQHKAVDSPAFVYASIVMEFGTATLALALRRCST